MKKFSFFYDGGAEGALSCIDFNAKNDTGAWGQWDTFNEDGDLTVRLVVSNLEDNQVLFQE